MKALTGDNIVAVRAGHARAVAAFGAAAPAPAPQPGVPHPMAHRYPAGVASRAMIEARARSEAAVAAGAAPREALVDRLKDEGS